MLVLLFLRKNTIGRALLKLVQMMITQIASSRRTIQDRPSPITNWAPYIRNEMMGGIWTAGGVYSMNTSNLTNRWIYIHGKRKWAPNILVPKLVDLNEWCLKDEFYRPINYKCSELIHRIKTQGQPCRLKCVLEKSGTLYRAKIEIEPLEGWQPLCHPNDLRPWQYHISLGKISVPTDPSLPGFMPVDNFDFWADWEEVINTFHNKMHRLKIEWVSHNFTMMLSETDSIQQNVAVGRLRNNDLGHSSQLSISA